MIAAMPSGYMPKTEIYGICMIGVGNNSLTPGMVRIETNGKLSVLATTTAGGRYQTNIVIDMSYEL